MPTIDLPEGVTRIILQAGTSKFYSLALDATAGIKLDPGTGAGTATHNGVVYTFRAADPAASSPAAPLSSDAPYNPDVA